MSLLGACPRKAVFRNLCVRLIPPSGTQNALCLPPIKTFAFLDLTKNLSFSDSLLGFQLDATTVFKIAAGDANGLGLLASDLRDLDFAYLGT